MDPKQFSKLIVQMSAGGMSNLELVVIVFTGSMIKKGTISKDDLKETLDFIDAMIGNFPEPEGGRQGIEGDGLKSLVHQLRFIFLEDHTGP